MWWFWLGILVAMGFLACTVWLVWEARIARDEFDASLARYEPRHAVTIPRADPDPWETILRDPEPAPVADTGTLERLTVTGELRAITDAWIAKHTTQEGTP